MGGLCPTVCADYTVWVDKDQKKAAYHGWERITQESV